jgi:hypothetical protein
MSQEVDKREEEAIQLGAKHCIYFGNNEEKRLYITEINRYVLSSVWMEMLTDPVVAVEKLLGSICLPSVSDLDYFHTLPAGQVMGVVTQIQELLEVKKSSTKKL